MRPAATARRAAAAAAPADPGRVANPLDRELTDELSRFEAAGLRRRLPPPDACARVDLRSNDFLGLRRDATVVAAMREALARHGAGSGAARLLGGGAAADHAEALLAEWLGVEAALLFPSGFQANLGVLGALAGPGDVVCSDALNHASLVDGCRLTRAHVLRFAHGDRDELARQLERAKGARRRLIAIESLHGMDGDLAPLAALNELAERHDAWLVVDEAHAAGVLGPRGTGGWAAAGLPNTRLAARVVTGGKALGVAGAFVAG
ncbi:MAG: aminotransferase class I/II-fold pyridoxal phosphate-dependent enzyme, partial [Planctomycetes bacterium]|nr:aminotransferase class I/II-fold pyridoxal phosphate-dependent enzyme [Planctomycetota bacterium]